MKRFLVVVSAAISLVAAGATWAAAGASAPTRVSRADATALSLKAIDAFKYDKKSLTAKAGVVKIVMKNTSPLPHNVAIKRSGINKKGKIVRTGGVSTVIATLKPGKYVFYCSVPGHEALGMKGTLIVK